MKRTIIIAGLVAGLVGWGLSTPLADRVFAQVNVNLFRGAGHAGSEIETTFKFKTIKGNYASVRVERNVLVVPTSYGEPFAVTGVATQSVIWYKDDEGRVRNVIVQNGNALVVTDQKDGYERKRKNR